MVKKKVSYLSARIERELTSLWEGVTEVKQVVKVETVQQDNLGNVEAQLAKLMGKEVQMREALQDFFCGTTSFMLPICRVATFVLSIPSVPTVTSASQ